MVAVRLEGVSKSFGGVVAVDSVSLEIPEGELFFLLGPSGCGKTTMLRTIAGFEAPSAGRVFFDARDVTDLPAHKRNTGMVFQNYALWPHMSVFENVAYGLRLRKVSSADISFQVDAALEMVQMSRERGRFPNQLSGGQQQRVALARALVVKPGCLLLDEPLSNLDARLRLEMRAEIRRIHAETGVTTIYVTHDQKEALSMAQRLAVLSDGRVIQIGLPGDVYRRPANDFVAAFIGETNFIPGRVQQVGEDSIKVDTSVGVLVAGGMGLDVPRPGDACVVSVRPEEITLAREGQSINVIEGRLLQYTFLGEVAQYFVRAGGVDLKVLVVAPAEEPPTDSAIRLALPLERVLVFPQPAAEA